MATPRADSYTVPAGTATVRLGKPAPVVVPQFDSVSLYSDDGQGTLGGAGQAMVVSLHESGGGATGSSYYTNGKQFRAAVSGLMAYETYNTFAFNTWKSGNSSFFYLRPVDGYGTSPTGALRESFWFGFRFMPNDEVTLITQRRLDAMILGWAPGALQYNPAKTVLRGGSMGGWGTMYYGLRRANVFASLYPDRPRWRYAYNVGKIAIPRWTSNASEIDATSSPQVRAEDGGGNAFTRLMDHIAYVSNTANKIPWIGWAVGRQDGYVQFSDHVAAVAAMRAARRGFAFSWNNGTHTSGPLASSPNIILQSYPYGLFEIGKGYPLFENHSGDQDPSDPTVLTGGINIGLTFRNVVESATGWSCEVTSVLGPCTVDVSPISDVFKAAVTPKTVNISAANDWQPVFF